MKAASSGAFVLPAVLAALVGAAAIAACSSKTPIPPEALGGCHPVGDASCRNFGAGGGGAGGGGGTGVDSGEPVDSPSGIEPTDAELACGQVVPIVASASEACATCLAAGVDAGSASCCAAAESCSMDSQCVGILTCEAFCTSGPVCDCAGSMPPASSLSTYNLLAECAQIACSGVCPMLQRVSFNDP
ncbi:MAG: hypothetical protein ACRENE_00555 [Polyangiaceae bacterium]